MFLQGHRTHTAANDLEEKQDLTIKNETLSSLRDVHRITYLHDGLQSVRGFFNIVKCN